jgi:hypothetical protein
MKSEQEVFDYVVGKTDDHWVWLGTLTDKGYPRVQIAGKVWRGVRLSLELAGRPAPKGHDVVQVCGEKLCVKPDHLEVFPMAAHRAMKNRKIDRSRLDRFQVSA